MAVEVLGSRDDVGDVVGSGVPSRRVLRSFVSTVVELPPGPELVSGLLGLMERDLSAREWVEVTVAWKKVVSFARPGSWRRSPRWTTPWPGTRTPRPARVAPTRPGRRPMWGHLPLAGDWRRR